MSSAEFVEFVCPACKNREKQNRLCSKDME